MDSNRGLELGKGIGRVIRESNSNSAEKLGEVWVVSHPLAVKKKKNNTIVMQSKATNGIKR